MSEGLLHLRDGLLLADLKVAPLLDGVPLQGLQGSRVLSGTILLVLAEHVLALLGDSKGGVDGFVEALTLLPELLLVKNRVQHLVHVNRMRWLDFIGVVRDVKGDVDTHDLLQVHRVLVS